ncbi:GTP cyclohydrolase II [Kocuria sp. CPCC 205292]|uniref:GTP cyclohydrolase II n=1 Tax=Kocuria cellulosilytica TaxID=3071451 RepID=UPI0034D45842
MRPDAPLVSSEPVVVPTPEGRFEVIGWQLPGGPGNAVAEHLSLTAPSPGRVPVGRPPLVRLHSECLTGDVFGSFRCDCGPQLHLALRRIAEDGGTLLYLRNHEGRGIGLVNKLRAYKLQDGGADTVEANELLGLPADARDYSAAAAILHRLGLSRIRLLSNNPAKAERLADLGIDVVAMVPNEVPARPENHDYLVTKRDRMRHRLRHVDDTTAPRRGAPEPADRTGGTAHSTFDSTLDSTFDNDLDSTGDLTP